MFDLKQSYPVEIMDALPRQWVYCVHNELYVSVLTEISDLRHSVDVGVIVSTPHRCVRQVWFESLEQVEGQGLLSQAVSTTTGYLTD